MFPWLVLKGLSYPSSALSYGEQVSTVRILPLDKIENAGCLRPERLLQEARFIGWGHVEELVSLIADVRKFEAHVLNEPIGNRRLRRTPPKFMGHMLDLNTALVLSPVAVEYIKHCATYFAVPKNEEVSRSIFNGSSLSKKCKVPPPVGLLDIVRVNRMWATQIAKGRVYGFCGDLRHFFHTIRVDTEIARYFGVWCGDQGYIWQVLPMGWSFSPVIAQGIGLLLFCARELGQESLFDEQFTQDPHLPSYLPIRGGGFLCLYYDNFLVVCESASTAERIKARLMRNLQRISGRNPEPLIKEMHSLRDAYGGHLVHLGCQYRIQNKRPTDSRAACISWRMKKTPENEDWTAPGSCRDIAGRLGKIVHRFLVEDRRLNSPEWKETAELIRHVGKVARSSGWHVMFNGSHEEMVFLEERRTWLCRNDWIDGRTPIAAKYLLISDASKWGLGWAIICLASGQLVSQHAEEWSVEWRTRHIYELEAYACIKCYEEFRATVNEVAPIVVVTDNAALAGGLHRGYSMSREVQEWFEQSGILSQEYDVMQVPSAANFVDELSRGASIALAVPLVVELLSTYRSGRHIYSGPRHDGTEEGIRHPEGDLDELLRNASIEETAVDHEAEEED